jgi:preprotein translocase subunit SecG
MLSVLIAASWTHRLVELTTWVTILHVSVSAIIIALVLLHSGRGGGVSDMFGGGVSSAAAGSSVVERNLDRATIICVVIWTFTTLGLAIRLQ